MNKILVIPDIHGRTFWKDHIQDIDKYDKVVFLGDYLDPYSFEEIKIEDVIDNFKEIIEFKKKYNDKVILLLGNHDIYYYTKLIGPSRYSYTFAPEIEKIFEQNTKLFQIAYETEKTLFTHAGVLKGWIESNKIIEIYFEPTQESLNSLLNGFDEDYVELPDGLYALLSISHQRGGRSGYGSCIWADVKEHDWVPIENIKYQVFGHTLQLNLDTYYYTKDNKDIKDGTEIINNRFAMLDCRHAFEYNEDTREFIKL